MHVFSRRHRRTGVPFRRANLAREVPSVRIGISGVRDIEGMEEFFFSYSTLNGMFARLGTDYKIRNQWIFAILEAMPAG